MVRKPRKRFRALAVSAFRFMQEKTLRGTGMKRVCEQSADRITNLPADVIQRILVLLPIKDAAKTAALSTKWRHHWRSIPQLVFDDGFAIKQGGSVSTEMVMNKLLFNVYKALLLHDGAVTQFVLSFPGIRSCHGNEIDQIIDFLSTRGLQKFTLNLSGGDKQKYKVHSALFCCLHLDWLRLRCCEFRQPQWFVGFSKLKILYMNGVTLPTDFFENFILKCPMLTNLVVDNCDGPSNLQVVAPRLRKFGLMTRGNVPNICFKHTPLLYMVVLDRNVQQEVVLKTIDTVALFASLPALQFLSVDFQFLQYFAASNHMNVPSRLPNPLHQLRTIRITSLDLSSLEKARLFDYLIMSSPNLRELTIKLDPSQPNQLQTHAATTIGSLLGAENRQGSGNCCLQQLRVFRIEECLGTQVELVLVKFVLATAPVLERIRIPSLQKLCSEKVIEFITEVMRFKRVSKDAEVIYNPK